MTSQDSSARLIEALQSRIAFLKLDSQLRASGAVECVLVQVGVVVGFHLIFASFYSPQSPADYFGRLSTLKQEADLLNRAAQYILAERVELARLLPQVPAPTTPFLGLPGELLSYIFEIGCTNPDPNSYPDEYDAFRDIVGATCRAFRSTLLKSPRCWTTIKYLNRTFLSSYYTRLDQHTQLLLDRSQNCAIRICVHFDPLYHRVLSYDKISTLLRPHLGRCISLSIIAEDFLAVERVFPPGAMPRLRQTRLSYYNSKSTQIRPPPWAIQESSVIQSLWIDVCALGSISTESFRGLRGATLTELHVEGSFPNGAMLELLAQCSALEQLYWHSRDHIATTCSTAFNFPHLTRLDFDNCTSTALDSLDAPKLREVLFSEAFVGQSESSRHSFFYTNKPFTCLQKLQLVSYADDGLIPTFIRRNPTITEIHLIPCHSTPAATTRRITRFLDQFGGRVQCSRLTYLSLAVPESVWKSHFFREMEVCIGKLLARLNKISLALSYAQVKDSDYAKGRVPLIGNLLDQFPGRIQIAGAQRRASRWWVDKSGN
jgi:hypothetical protein